MLSACWFVWTAVYLCSLLCRAPFPLFSVVNLFSSFFCWGSLFMRLAIHFQRNYCGLHITYLFERLDQLNCFFFISTLSVRTLGWLFFIEHQGLLLFYAGFCLYCGFSERCLNIEVSSDYVPGASFPLRNFSLTFRGRDRQTVFQEMGTLWVM